MRRLRPAARADWREQVEATGLVWHSAGGAPYWDETVAYAFDSHDVAMIEEATRDLYALFLQAGDYVVENRLFDRFAIPPWCWPLIEEAWKAEPPALNYGRFDLGYDGRGPPKLFEFNCDTPTSLLEAAVVQWRWKEAVFPAADQYNSLHDKLVAKWRDIAPFLASPTVHFTHAREASGEDAVTTAYLADTARSAGLNPIDLPIAEVGWADGRFWDLQPAEIRTLYHLYPWEWLVHEAFGPRLLENAGRTAWIEPIWKMIWSNKAILPILWDLFPRHPNLLWASTEGPVGDSYVVKPILGREGANVRVVRGGAVAARKDGPYGEAPVVWQGLFDLPSYEGACPVIGAWIVDGEAAGMGIREDGLITGNLSRFVPHIID
jgi:glutathionylspermidine synthase